MFQLESFFFFFADKKVCFSNKICLFACTNDNFTNDNGQRRNGSLRRVVSVTKPPKSWEDLSEMPRLFITEPWQQFHFIYS